MRARRLVEHPVRTSAIATAIFFLLAWLFQYADGADAGRSAVSALIAAVIFGAIFVAAGFYGRSHPRPTKGKSTR